MSCVCVCVRSFFFYRCLSVFERHSNVTQQFSSTQNFSLSTRKPPHHTPQLPCTRSAFSPPRFFPTLSYLFSWLRDFSTLMFFLSTSPLGSSTSALLWFFPDWGLNGQFWGKWGECVIIPLQGSESTNNYVVTIASGIFQTPCQQKTSYILSMP